MKDNEFKVVLTNGNVLDTYCIYAMNETEAVILAQAQAINNARGYSLVSVEMIK